MGDRFIVCERGEVHREKFAPFVGSSHVRDEAGFELFVLFGAVLVVEDAVLFVAETDAGEEVFRGVAVVTAGEVFVFPTPC